MAKLYQMTQNKKIVELLYFKVIIVSEHLIFMKQIEKILIMIIL